MSAELGALSPEDTELWIPHCPALSPGLVETVPPGVGRPASHVPLCTVATQMLASTALGILLRVHQGHCVREPSCTLPG